MKKTFLVVSLAAFCFSCSNSGDSGSKPAGGSTADNPDYKKGLDLVAKSDCFGCHKITETSVGPAYNLIGQKYENTEANVNLLAEKIQHGGSGNWGTVPMAAHAALSKEDAVAMAKYILLLKDEK
ncbi:c-type cytochrome [Ferruginibacter sp.]